MSEHLRPQGEPLPADIHQEKELLKREVGFLGERENGAYLGVFTEAGILGKHEIRQLKKDVVGRRDGLRTRLTFRFAQTSMDKYEKFLASGASPDARRFASSQTFQDYIKKCAEVAAPGPFFQRALELLTDGGQEAIDFVRASSDGLAWLDTNYFIFREQLDGEGKFSGLLKVNPAWKGSISKMRGTKNEELQEVFETYMGFCNDLLDCVAGDYGILPVERKLVVKNFIDFADTVSPWNIPFRNYDPEWQLKRISLLCWAVTDTDREFLAKYVQYTKSSDSEWNLDNEILQGDTKRAKALTAFFKRCFEINDLDIHFPLDPNEFREHWAGLFLRGEITADELDKAADSFFEISDRYDGLERGARDDMIFYDDDSLKIMGLDELVTTTEILGDGPLIAKLVGLGICPTKDLRDKVRDFGNLDELASRFLMFSNNVLPWVKAVLGKRDPDIVNSWISKACENPLVYENLQQIEDGLKIIGEAFAELMEGSPMEDAEGKIWHEKIGQILMSDIFPKDVLLASVIGLLIMNRILPTDNLVNYVAEHKEEAIDELFRLKRKTKLGGFNPKDAMQRDLEYMEYLKLRGNKTGGSEEVQNFEGLEFVQETDRKPELTLEESREAEVAAFEAATLFHFIKGRKDAGRKVTVIGNLRYGGHFVIEPLRPYLENEGITVSIHYVRSGNNSQEDLDKTLNAISEYVKTYGFDDVVIVDGTSNPYPGDKNIPRLPRALETYSNILSKKGYSIIYWVPVPKEEILVGNQRTEYVSSSDQKPQFILANPVVPPDLMPEFPDEFKEHTPGFFDDPERHTRTGTKIAFSPQGVKTFSFGRTEEEVVYLVQNRMQQTLARWIRATDPIFKTRF